MKNHQIILENSRVLSPGYFNIRSLPHAIFIPTWLNLASFSLQIPSKITSWRRLGTSGARLGSLLERLGRVLERLGLILERLGDVLERFAGVENASWKLSAILVGPFSPLRLAAVTPQHLMKKVTF